MSLKSEQINVSAKTAFILLLLLVNSLYSQYSIQVKATKDSSIAYTILDSLRTIGHHSYITTSKEDPLLFRIRIGPFLLKEDANLYVAFSQIQNPWITSVKSDANIPQKMIVNFIVDSLQLTTKKLYWYPLNSFPAIVIYIKNFGLEASILPSTLNVYAKHKKRPIKMDSVTGFEEDNGNLRFGKVLKLYFDPVGKPIESFKQEINVFSHTHGVPIKSVKDNILFFNDGYDATYTILNEFNFKKGKIIAYPKMGFDFYSLGHQKKKWIGDINNIAPTVNLGNANMKVVNTSKPQYILQNKTILLFHPSAEMMKLGIAFLN